MKTTIRSILCAILVWILGVGLFLTSFSIPIMDDPALQANIVLAIGIIPGAMFETFHFYRNGYMHPAKLALTFMLTAALLDALITVPVFVIPEGGSYAAFFTEPMFYLIMVEFYLIVTLYGKQIQKIKA